MNQRLTSYIKLYKFISNYLPQIKSYIFNFIVPLFDNDHNSNPIDKFITCLLPILSSNFTKIWSKHKHAEKFEKFSCTATVDGNWKVSRMKCASPCEVVLCDFGPIN